MSGENSPFPRQETQSVVEHEHSGQSAALASLREVPSADVLIIGGGINGIATFRDVALQGVSVVLVERNDFGSGASAASSHMIHGGVRYLENGEFRLVKESLQERNRLLASAPHYVRPLKTTIPIFSVFSGLLAAPLRFLTHSQGRPRERGALLIKIGLVLYDLFGRDGGKLPRHRFLGRKRSLAEMPDLHPDIKYTATYFDAAMENPERLALDVLRDGLEAGPHARAFNYVSAAGATPEGITLRDELGGETFCFTPRVVLNTSGPWTDLTNEALGQKTAFMGGTKGSHIVMDNPELFEACDGREIFFENSDGRIVLMYPILGRVLVGTTDIPVSMAEESVCTEEEVDYFFDLIKRVFPAVTLDRSHIVYRYAGVRPLPASGDTQPGFVSRDYRIVPGVIRGTIPLVSLVGGKWTTFRALGEHLADETLKILGVRRVHSTLDRLIGGGRDFPTEPESQKQWAIEHAGAVTPERALVLLRRYGTVAARIIQDLTPEDRPLLHHGDYSVEEILSLVRREWVLTLSDIVYRRTKMAFRGEITPELVEELADILAPVLGWSPTERSQQISSLVIQENHRES